MVGHAPGGGDGAVVVVPVALLGLWIRGDNRKNRVLGVGQGSGSRGRYSWYQSYSLTGLDLAPHRCRQAKELIEKQDESDVPAHGQVQEEVSAEESVAHPEGAAVGGPQQQEYQPPPQHYADWFPLAEQFFRNLYQGA
ncbi:hypothetical protein Taro_008901 [Colocasia esculenta]|uniref:Uncharacterized protein n=1 Tax=Colocasia esculenta TaxID=4460 RepID=A0A843U3J2_COLES|nr:hypothetical protein [Colocasia esculenta]